MAALAVLSFAIGQFPPTTTKAASLHTEKAACARVKNYVSAARHLSVSTISSCDFIAPADSRRGYYVMALHSRRPCDGMCSTNMGWFAVHKKSGRVFEWNIAEMKLGKPVE